MKRWLRRFLWALSAVLVLVGAVFAWYARQSLPQTDGELRLPGLRAAVEVRRDASDVTHIQARDPRDAWMVMGYVHAQERGWQLEFNRRVMRGTLSELLGPATLDTDRLMRTLGIREAAQRQVARLPTEAQASLQAYSDGVNAFFAQSDQALSPEFLLMRTDPREAARAGRYWDPADSAGWALMMALDLGGNWGNEVARLSALQVLDTQQLWQLFPPYPGEPPASATDLARLYRELGVYRPRASRQSEAPEPTRAVAGGLATDVVAWAQELGNIEGKGSNNWVVDGSRSTTGKPLLANDPHLGLSAPAIWYFARLQAPDVDGMRGMDVIGATLPGTPFVVLGRTSGVAWGFTNTGPDVQDLYLEQLHPEQPDQYRVPAPEGQTTWAAFETRVETIRVKGQPDVQHTVRRSRHGPVISNVPGRTHDLIDTGRYALALRWTALEDSDSNVQATLESNRAQSGRSAGGLPPLPRADAERGDGRPQRAHRLQGCGARAGPRAATRHPWHRAGTGLGRALRLGGLAALRRHAARRRHQRLDRDRQPTHPCGRLPPFPHPGLGAAVPAATHRSPAGADGPARRAVVPGHACRPAIGCHRVAAAAPAKDALRPCPGPCCHGCAQRL